MQIQRLNAYVVICFPAAREKKQFRQSYLRRLPEISDILL
jgi:hypothetical protein